MPSSPLKAPTTSSAPTEKWPKRAAIALILVGIGGKCLETTPPESTQARSAVPHTSHTPNRRLAYSGNFTLPPPTISTTENPESVGVTQEIPEEVLRETGITVIMEMAQDGSLAQFYQTPGSFEGELSRRIAELLPPNASLEVAISEALTFLTNNAEATADAGNTTQAAYMINLTPNNTQRAVQIAMEAGDREAAVAILRSQITTVNNEPEHFYLSCFAAHPTYIDSLWPLLNPQEQEWIYQALQSGIRIARDDLDGISSSLLEIYQRIIHQYFPDRTV